VTPAFGGRPRAKKSFSSRHLGLGKQRRVWPSEKKKTSGVGDMLNNWRLRRGERKPAPFRSRLLPLLSNLYFFVHMN